MIRFTEENGALTARLRNETIRIEGWGNNALRVRTTLRKSSPRTRTLLLKTLSTAQRSLSTAAMRQPK